MKPLKIIFILPGFKWSLFAPSFPNRNTADDKLIMIIENFPYSHIGVAIKKLGGFNMPLDINKYRKYVDEFDLTEEQKVELLQTVWSIMENFVDTAFNQHPVEQCHNRLPEKDLQGPVIQVKSNSDYLPK